MRLRIGVFLAISVMALAACSSTQSNTDEGAAPAGGAETGAGAAASFGSAARWDLKPDGALWTAFAQEGLRRHGGALIASVPGDIDAYCPAYRGGDAARRTAFWVGLMSALAKWESNYDPTVKFTEPFNDSSGNPVVSRGLLQLSKESANGYGCGIGDAEELHDPEVNLSCAVRIFNRLVVRDGVIASQASPWKGAAAYWSPFRRANRRADLQGWTADQDYCRA